MRRLAVVVLVLVGLTACGSDDGNENAETPDTTTATSEAPVELAGKVKDAGSADATGDSTLDVKAVDFSFDPTFIKITKGQKLTLKISNGDQAPHTFTSTELAVDEEVAAGETASVEVTVPDSEAVLFFCRFHQSGGMQGAFYSKEGAKVGATPSEAPSGY